jgi:hypothetical protein
MTSYQYTKEINSDRLTLEIQQSAIITAVDHIETLGNEVTVIFKADLSNDDKTILDGIILVHINTPLAELPQLVNVANSITTQFERNDLDLKMACAKIDTVNGEGKISIKIPGTHGSAEGRYIGGGDLFFDEAHAGDKVCKIAVVDVDDLLGYGANTELKTYTDSDVAVEEQGWYVPVKRGFLEIEPMGFYGFIPAGMYLEITLKKGSSILTGTGYVNLYWGITSV